jgi:hypothetical protein
MVVYAKINNNSGFITVSNKGIATIIVIIGTTVLVLVGVVLLGRLKDVSKSKKTQEDWQATQSKPETATFEPESTPGTNIVEVKTPTPEPGSPPLKSIAISGFSYEDRNDDGIFNSDDPKIPYTQYYLYDSYKPDEQISSANSGLDGSFSVTLQVRGNLILKPTVYSNFRPREAGSRSYSSSTSDIQVGFRSSSAPVANLNVGIIEGDVFQDLNKNLIRDPGEESVFFYTLYLKDEYGNYYNTNLNTQATETSGHFKYLNLPIDRTYIIWLSNPGGEYEILKPETRVTLNNDQKEVKHIEIPIIRH